MLCLSCVAQQSNVMSIEPNWEARTLEHGTSLGATNGYDKTCCVTIFAATIVQHVVITNDTDTQRKQWKSSCQTSTNLLNQHLLSALPGDKIDGMSAGRCQKTKEVLDNTKACVSQQGSHKETTTVIHRGRRGVNTRRQ